MVTCLADLIGVDFAYGGRGPSAYDCWGVARECYARWHGVILPDYRSTPDPETNGAVIDRERSKHWVKLDDLKVGSLLLMSVDGFGAHVGFMHKPTRFIQAIDSVGVVESRIAAFKARILGAYLYAGDAGLHQSDYRL